MYPRPLPDVVREVSCRIPPLLFVFVVVTVSRTSGVDGGMSFCEERADGQEDDEGDEDGVDLKRSEEELE